MDSYNYFSDRKEIEALAIPELQMDLAEYINQTHYGDDCLEGEWWYDVRTADGRLGLVYGGTFGNDNSPGADSYTHVEVYFLADPDQKQEFLARVAKLETMPEYADEDDEEAECYQVIVGNIGTVYSGDDLEEAERVYEVYVKQSQSGVGRAGRENVLLLRDNDDALQEFDYDLFAGNVADAADWAASEAPIDNDD
jgi:hypothetical protein